DLLLRAVARPGADGDTIADGPAEERVHGHAEGLRIGVPDGAFEAVVLAAERQRQVLQGKIEDRSAEEIGADRLDARPLVIAVELPEADRAVGKRHAHDELRQLVELRAPRRLAAHWQHVERLCEALRIDHARMGGDDDFVETEGNDGLVGALHASHSPVWNWNESMM